MLLGVQVVRKEQQKQTWSPSGPFTPTDTVLLQVEGSVLPSTQTLTGYGL